MTDKFFRVKTKSFLEQCLCSHGSIYTSKEHWCADCGIPLIETTKVIPSPYGPNDQPLTRHNYYPNWIKRLSGNYISFLDIVKEEE